MKCSISGFILSTERVSARSSVFVIVDRWVEFQAMFSLVVFRVRMPAGF